MHTWVEHTAELELRIEATGAEAVFAQALAALRELLDPGEPDEGGDAIEAVRHCDVELDAPDLPALLAAWIDELAYLAETQDLIPLRAQRLQLEEDTRLRATVAGRPGRPRHLVKGATYHRLSFERQDDRYVATVVLDV